MFSSLIKKSHIQYQTNTILMYEKKSMYNFLQFFMNKYTVLLPYQIDLIFFLQIQYFRLFCIVILVLVTKYQTNTI